MNTPPSHDNSRDELSRLRRELKEYNDILNILPDIIYKIDPQGQFVYVSKSITVLGYNPDELIGKHFSVLIHPDDLPNVSRDAVLPKFRGTITGDKSAPKLFDERRTGRRVTRNLIIRLLAKPDDASPKASTENRTIQGEVMATGMYSSPVVNEKKEFKGSGGKIHLVDKEPAGNDSSTFYGEIATFGKYDRDVSRPDKQFQGTVGIIRDITERKRLEERKQELETQLFHSKKMQAIGELAGGIAHDFNNLLSIMLGHTEMIAFKAQPTTPALTKYTDTIMNTIHHASEITGKLLTFARKGKYSDSPIDVHEIINDTIDLLRHSVDKKIELQKNLAASQSTISGDANQLKNAFINIAINARDAMPEGGVLTFQTSEYVPDTDTVSQSKKVVKPGSYINISIGDTGEGMDETTMDRLFEPFYTTKGLGKGTGLGLACVDGIVEMHNGFIKVQSEKGSGTTFHLFLPLIPPRFHSANPESSRENKVSRHALHILLIDDEEQILDVQSELLSELGYTVTAFNESKNAIQYYRKHYKNVDIVLIDMIMPVCNGRECFRQLKSIHNDICAIISTGYSYEQEAESLTREGIAGFIQKPFTSQKLNDVISAALTTCCTGGSEDTE